jgi:CheY-like chemotaxis protein
MDISMPIMDGFACLEEMTSLYGCQRPPTIAITTGVMYENPAVGTDAKFDQWWDKTDQSALLFGIKALMSEI